MIYILSWNH